MNGSRVVFVTEGRMYTCTSHKRWNDIRGLTSACRLVFGARQCPNCFCPMTLQVKSQAGLLTSVFCGPHCISFVIIGSDSFLNRQLLEI